MDEEQIRKFRLAATNVTNVYVQAMTGVMIAIANAFRLPPEYFQLTAGCTKDQEQIKDDAKRSA